MGVLFKTGVFTKDQSGTNGATQDIIVGFRPRAIILWGEYHVTSPGLYAGDSFFSIGISDGLHHRSICGAIDDNQAAVTDTMRSQRASSIIFANADEVNLIYAHTSFSNDGFTMIWDLNTDTTGVEIHYTVIGGTDVMGEVGSINITTTGKQYITTSRLLQNINDDEGICFLISSDNPTIPSNTTPHSIIGMGAASSITNQFAIGHTSDNNIDNSLTGAYYSDSSITRIGLGGVDTLTGVFAGFTGNGFAIDWTKVTAPSLAFYLIIKGGQWKAGTEQTKTTGGLKVTTTPFKPRGILLASTRLTTSTAAESKDLSCDFGSADGINNNSVTQTDKNASATSVTGRASSITKCTRVLNPSLDDVPVVGSEANLDSFNETNFTLNWTTVDDIAHTFGYIVCGDGLKYQRLVPDGDNTDSIWKDVAWGNGDANLYNELDELEPDFLESAINTRLHAVGFNNDVVTVRLARMRFPDVSNNHYKISFWAAAGSHPNDTVFGQILFRSVFGDTWFFTDLIPLSSTIDRYSYILTETQEAIILNNMFGPLNRDAYFSLFLWEPYRLDKAFLDNSTFLLNSSEPTPTMLTFKPDGTRMYWGGTTSATLYQYDVVPAWDTSLLFEDVAYTQAMYFGIEDANPKGIFWKPDGHVIYMVGMDTQTVYQYNMNDVTNAWDITSVSPEDTFALGFNPTGVSFKPDGTKMYIVNTTTTRIREYNLSTPWFVSTAVFFQEKDLSTNIYEVFNDSNIRDLFFREDGKQLFTCSTTSGGVILKYNLSIPWDISTIVVDHPYLLQKIVNAEDDTPEAIFFKPDGLMFFITGASGDVYGYTVHQDVF